MTNTIILIAASFVASFCQTDAKPTTETFNVPTIQVESADIVLMDCYERYLQKGPQFSHSTMRDA